MPTMIPRMIGNSSSLKPRVVDIVQHSRTVGSEDPCSRLYDGTQRSEEPVAEWRFLDKKKWAVPWTCVRMCKTRRRNAIYLSAFAPLGYRKTNGCACTKSAIQENWPVVNCLKDAGANT